MYDYFEPIIINPILLRLSFSSLIFMKLNFNVIEAMFESLH